MSTGRGFEHPAFFMRYDIEISGIEAAPQGSKIRTRYGMREASERLGPWRDAVRVEALAACGELIEEACSVAVEFRFLRPKGDFGAKGNLRPSARTHYTTKKNDIDKCCRSLLDGLTGAAFADDCLVVVLSACQRYCLPGERPGATVTIETLS